MKMCLLISLICVCASAGAVKVNEVKAMLDKIPGHPRLFLLKGEEKNISDKIAKDPQLKAVWELLKNSAEKQLTAPALERKLEGRRLLDVSREFLKRIINLSFMYRMTGEKKYADRAIKDMMDAASFEDWNPKHFLDVAELTAALAIGTDWLHDYMDEATRKALHKAIIEKGLKASIGNDYWTKGINNWNQVCNGGMVLGALAIAEDDPDLAQKMIIRAVEGVPNAMKEYEPDGAYPEGPMYWDYGTSYNVVMIDALEKALGTDFGLSKMKGFSLTAKYYLHATGPIGLYFNYADCAQRGQFNPSVAMTWFASRQKTSGITWNERPMLKNLADNPAKIKSAGRFLPFLLIWAEPVSGQSNEPPDKYYFASGATPVAIFRTGWDREATFVGIKGGKAANPHGHMDAGTFVFDAIGERWAEDLGMQGYYSIESRGMNLWGQKEGAERWKIFRLGASSHNVLMVDGKDHKIDGVASFTEHTDHSATLDMSPVFAGQLKTAIRKIELNPDGTVKLSDEVTADENDATVRWVMMTRAKVELTADGAKLTRNGKTMSMKVTGIKDLKMKTYVSDPPPAEYDARNEGTIMVGFEVKLAKGEKLAWDIEFLPKR